MTTKKHNNNIRLRTKSIKIICGEDTALAIVTPFVNLTAYLLTVTKTNELPEFESLTNAVKHAKIQLAILMANLLTRPFDPEQLSTILIEVIAFGGYFKVSLRETKPNNKKGITVQGWNITLQCQTQCSLIEKISQTLRIKYKAKGIVKTDEELNKEIVDNFIKLGI